ncbi:MAG: preprotein translocase subunit SecG [Verrucomicrobiota bacterium]|jgi:protein translocase SecG subunit
MSLLIGFLTFILVVNCLFLMLLILLQLPKKEAGAGLAFGGGATDALFGAGSGTALTKITKWSATTFLGMSVGLWILNANYSEARRSGEQLDEALRRKAAATAPAPAPALPTTSSSIELPRANTGQVNQLTITNPAAPAPANTTTTTPAAPQTASPAPAPPGTSPAPNTPPKQ